MKQFVITVLCLCALALAERASSQCSGPAGISGTKYGNSCPFQGQTASLDGVYNVHSCTVGLLLSNSQPCCGTILLNRFLFVGTQPLTPGITLPELLPGCLIHVQPTLMIVQPATAGYAFYFKVPPVASPVTFYAQGVNDYLTTPGGTHHFQSSNGLRIDVF